MHRSAPPRPAVIGVDVGTSSSKGVLVDLDGRLLASCVLEHAVQRPGPGMVEMDGSVWWEEFVAIAQRLLAEQHVDVQAVGVSGMGPCVLLTDAADEPLRPAILYGVDTRAGRQIERLNDRYGADEILRRCGSALSSQAAGAKVAWVADEEPELFAHARRLYMPSSFLARRLTGAYVLDHHSASQCTPLYDSLDQAWYRPWADEIAGAIDLPPLQWPGDAAGTVSADAAAATGLPAGIPVITGTIDAWSEALSVGAQRVGDLMLMYGTTMFLVHTVPEPLTSPALWGTVGALPGTRNLAGGMATSGAITSWLRELFGSPDYGELLELAARSGVGANGLLMLPYFAGERTPIMDPDARGVIAGLTLSHTRGDLYRAALEATGYAVRHNLEAFEAAGGDIRRVVAVGVGRRAGCGRSSSRTSPPARRRSGRSRSARATAQPSSPPSLSRPCRSTPGTPCTRRSGRARRRSSSTRTSTRSTATCIPAPPTRSTRWPRGRSVDDVPPEGAADDRIRNARSPGDSGRGAACRLHHRQR